MAVLTLASTQLAAIAVLVTWGTAYHTMDTHVMVIFTVQYKLSLYCDTLVDLL